jgi:hypothetical protein
MKAGQFITLSDFDSLKSNGLQPVETQVLSVGALSAERQVFRIAFLSEDFSKAVLNMTPAKGDPLNIVLTYEPLLPVNNRRQMVENGEGFLFVNASAPAGADLNTTLSYVADINAPEGDKYLEVLDAYGSYNEVPARDGLSGVKLIGHLVVYEAEADANKGTYLVVFEYGSPDNKDGGLITLYRGKGIAPHEIK